MADILSIAGNFVGGVAKQEELQFEARQESIAAAQERTAGAADALEITKAANETLATNIARSFGSGGRIAAGGSNEAIIKQTLSESSFARRVARRGGEQRASVRRASSQQLRTQAQFALFTGLLSGAQSASSSQRFQPTPSTSRVGTRTPTGGQTRTGRTR